MPITTPPYQVPSVDVTPDPPIFSLVTTFKVLLAEHSYTNQYCGSGLFRVGSGIRDPEKLILDPGTGSRGKKNTGLWIRNTETKVVKKTNKCAKKRTTGPLLYDTVYVIVKMKATNKP